MKKTLLISGGSNGIGKACVELFLENNWQVFNLDIQKPKNNLDVWIKCDLTDTKQIKHVIRLLKTKTSSIDCLISNAGKHLSKTIEETTDQLFNHILNLNLKASFMLIRESLPLLKKAPYSSIIAIGSDQSTIAKANSAIYGLTKAAISQLMKSLAIDYAKDNITANCIAAGTIDTPLYQNAIKVYSEKSGMPLEKINQEEAAQQLVNRIGKPEEIAAFAFFLASENARFITGATLACDGGYTAR